MKETIIPLEVWKEIIQYLDKNWGSVEIVGEHEDDYGSMVPEVDWTTFKYAAKDAIKKFSITNKEAKDEIEEFKNDVEDAFYEDLLNYGWEDGESKTIDWDGYFNKWIDGTLFE